MQEAVMSKFEIKTSTPAAVMAMLQFIYTGDLDLPLDNSLLPSSASNELVPLLDLARQYEVHALCPIVANLLVEGLSVENAKVRSVALKLHQDHPGVAPAYTELLQKFRENEDLLKALI